MMKKLAVLVTTLGLICGAVLLSSGQSRFVAESSLTLPLPPAPIWERLTAVGGWPQWWPGVLKATLAPGWQPGAELHIAFQGDPAQEPAVVEAVTSGSALSWRRPGVLGSETRTTIALQPSAEQTLVLLRSEILGPQAVLARWSSKDDFRHYQELVLQRLGESLQPPLPGSDHE